MESPDPFLHGLVILLSLAMLLALGNMGLMGKLAHDSNSCAPIEKWRSGQ
jgi:hypothetical protein